MKNIHKIFYAISFLIALILLGTYIYLNQTDSEENINVSENKTKVEKIISQKDEQTSDNPKIEEDQNNLPETDEIEESQPKEIRIVAEEILYPDEYDFGDSMSSVFVAAGKPIKLDTLPFIKLKEGDSIELEFNGILINAIIKNTDIKYYTEDETDEDLGEVTTFWLDGKINPELDTTLHNSVSGNVSYDDKGVVDASLWIDSKQGEYQFDIYKNIGYYVEEYARQKEVYDRGIRID